MSPAPKLATPLPGTPAVSCRRPPTYLVSYRIKLAELRYGRIVGFFFAPCTRRFATNELNIVLAELYQEIGPSPYLLGLEILTIRRLTQPPAITSRRLPSE